MVMNPETKKELETLSSASKLVTKLETRGLKLESSNQRLEGQGLSGRRLFNQLLASSFLTSFNNFKLASLFLQVLSLEKPVS